MRSLSCLETPWLTLLKCSTGEPPCENCRRLIATNSFRMWLVPCSFKRLDERREYLTPGKSSGINDELGRSLAKIV